MQTITLRVAENGGGVPMTPEQIRVIEAVSPTADVERVEGGLRITIHDLHGAHSAELADGTPGDPGYSPIVSISPIAGGHRVTITDTEGTHAFDVMDGDDYTLTAEDRAAIAGMTAGLVSVPVQDVQIDGTSILNNGVANVPVAGTGAAGVLRVANDSDTKSGNSAQRINTPYRQHAATFYGLAKAAGDSTQSASSNAVGTYTDDALVKIQKMLGVYEPPWELLNEITMESEGRIDLTADDNGTPYSLISAYVDIYYPANSTSASTGYDRYYFIDENGAKLTAETSRYQTNTANQTKFIYIMRQGGLAMAVYARAAVTGGTMALQMKYTGVKFVYGNIVRIYMDTNDVEPAGAIIKIYGQRAY